PYLYSAYWPLPRDRRSVVTRNDRFAEPLLERDRSALGQGLQRLNQRGRVGNDQHLRALRGAGDQTAESRQQIRVQAGLWLVEHQQARWARRQERGDPEQIPKRSVGQLGGSQRAQQSMLSHLNIEPPVLVGNVNAGAGKRVIDCAIE